MLGVVAAAVGWRAAIAPVLASPAGVYSPALIERGQGLAALGNCVACHTAEGGLPGAGGDAGRRRAGVGPGTRVGGARVP